VRERRRRGRQLTTQALAIALGCELRANLLEQADCDGESPAVNARHDRHFVEDRPDFLLGLLEVGGCLLPLRGGRGHGRVEASKRRAAPLEGNPDNW
jgi:hypothetical protein